MPLIKVVRKGITPTVRKVPTSTAAAMLPMTMARVGAEAATETEELVKVEDLGDAFRKFEPKLKFQGNAGPEETEFRADLRFRSIKDFDPENLQKRQENQHRSVVPLERSLEAADGAQGLGQRHPAAGDCKRFEQTSY